MAGDLNISQLPIATTTGQPDLLYVGKSPFDVTDDRAITYANFTNQVVTVDSYNGLTTSNKTIQGSINELKSSNGSAVGTPTFYLDDTTIIPIGTQNSLQVNTLSTSPITTTEITDSVVVNNSTLPVEAYLFNSPLNRTSWDAGEWVLGSFVSVSATGAGASSLITGIYSVINKSPITITITGTGTSRTATISSGSVFLLSDANADITLSGYLQTPSGLYQITLYSSAQSVTITVPSTYVNEATVVFSLWRHVFNLTTGTLTSTSIIEYSPTFAEGSISTNLDDKLGTIYFARTARTSNTTISYTHNGTSRYSHFHTSFEAMHNDLAGKQLANTGVTWGHISDQVQSIYGTKTFDSAPIFSSLTTSHLLGIDSGKNLISTTIIYDATGISCYGNLSSPYSSHLTLWSGSSNTSYTSITSFDEHSNLIFYSSSGSATINIDAIPFSGSDPSVMNFGSQITSSSGNNFNFYGAVTARSSFSANSFTGLILDSTMAMDVMPSTHSNGRLQFSAVTGTATLDIDAIPGGSFASLTRFGYNAYTSASSTEFDFYGAVTSRSSIAANAFTGSTLDSSLAIDVNPANHVIGRVNFQNNISAVGQIDFDVSGASVTTGNMRFLYNTTAASKTFEVYAPGFFNYGDNAGTILDLLKLQNESHGGADDQSGTETSLSYYQRLYNSITHASGSMLELGKNIFGCENAWQSDNDSTKNSYYRLELNRNGTPFTTLRIASTGLASLSNIWSYDLAPTFTAGSNQLATVKYIDDRAITDQAQTFSGIKTFINNVISNSGFINNAYNGATLDSFIKMDINPANHHQGNLYVQAQSSMGDAILNIDALPYSSISNSSTINIGSNSSSGVGQAVNIYGLATFNGSVSAIDSIANVAGNAGGISIVNIGAAGYPSLTLWNGAVGADRSWRFIVYGNELRAQCLEGPTWTNSSFSVSPP